MTEAAVKVPGVGSVKREHLLYGGAAVAVGAGVLVWRRRSAGELDESVAGVEPTAAEGDYNAGGYADTGDFTYTSPAGGSTVTPTVSGSTGYTETDPASLPPSTNAEWSNRAVDRLSDVGYDPQAVATALGRYLGRTAQANATGVEIIRTAHAMLGPPPVGDFSIIEPAAPVATTPTPPPVTPTPVTPAPAKPVAPAPLKAPAAPKVETLGTDKVTIRWTGVPNAASYLVGRSGTSYLEPSGLDCRETMRGLKPGTKYTFTVRAVDAKGNRGPASAGLTVTTKR